MDTLAKADIFFFVTTACVVISTFILAIALFYLIRFLKVAGDLVHKVKGEAEHIVDDVSHLRQNVKQKAELASRVVSVATGARLIKTMVDTWQERKATSENSTKQED